MEEVPLDQGCYLAANMKRQVNNVWVYQRVIIVWPWGVIIVYDRKGGGS